MANHKVCDVCGCVLDEDNPKVAKLFLSPTIPGQAGQDHGNYSKHMDIGRCCSENVLGLGKWQPRLTQPHKRPRRRKKVRA